MTRDSLLAVERRLSAASGPDAFLDREIENILGDRHRHIARPYTQSIDSALALVSRCLPEWQWSVSNRAPAPHNGRAYLNNGELQLAGMTGARNPKFKWSEVTASTPALALCLALCRALLAKEQTP